MKNVTYEVQYYAKQNEKPYISIEGEEEEVNVAITRLHSFQNEIKLEYLSVKDDLSVYASDFLIEEFSKLQHERDKTLQDCLYDFEKRFKCKISEVIERPTHASCSASQNKSVSPSRRNSKNTTPGNGDSDHHYQENGVLFQINNNVHLHVKGYGNIVHDKSSLLVCVLPRRRDITQSHSSILQDFMNKFPELQEKVKRLLFPEGKPQFLYTNSNQCIAFVKLPDCENEPKYRNILKEIIKKSMDFQLKSISFPALGYDKIYKFSAEFISENFFSALKRNIADERDNVGFKSHGLQKITFYANIPELFEKMKEMGQQYSPCIQPNPSHQSSASKDEPWSMIDRDERTGEHRVTERKIMFTIVHLNSSDLKNRLKQCVENFCAMPQ